MNTTFDNLSCEEIFELNAMCDQWQSDAIEAQDADAEYLRAHAEEAFWNDLGVDVKN